MAYYGKSMVDCIKCKYNEFGDCALLNDKEISFFYAENGGHPDWCPLKKENNYARVKTV